MKTRREPITRKHVYKSGRVRLVLAVSLAVLGVAMVASAALATSSRHSRSVAAGETSVVGSWHVTVNVDGSPTPFDALYLINRDGGFFRIDGRNNVPGLGNWGESTNDRVVITVVLFTFNAAGQRVGTISSNILAWVEEGVLHGTFTATGVDLIGNPLPGFPKTGTFSGERIVANPPDTPLPAGPVEVRDPQAAVHHKQYVPQPNALPVQVRSGVEAWVGRRAERRPHRVPPLATGKSPISLGT